MKLITEADFRDYEVIRDKESKDKPPAIKLKGVYIQCDQKNGNGRTYSFEMMKPEVEAFVKEYVEKHSLIKVLQSFTNLCSACINSFFCFTVSTSISSRTVIVISKSPLADKYT